MKGGIYLHYLIASLPFTKSRKVSLRQQTPIARTFGPDACERIQDYAGLRGVLPILHNSYCRSFEEEREILRDFRCICPAQIKARLRTLCVQFFAGLKEISAHTADGTWFG